MQTKATTAILLLWQPPFKNWIVDWYAGPWCLSAMQILNLGHERLFKGNNT